MTSHPVHRPVVLDIAGTALSSDDRRRLLHPLTGGVILFGRNWQDRQQLCELTAHIKALRPDLLVCVDQEGGRVQRFRTDGFVELPPMSVFGQLVDVGGEGLSAALLHAMDLATACGHVLAAQLRACGVDFSFTPVLDLNYGTSRVIGDRAFHRSPEVVSLLARALIHGLARVGVRNCGKHFPGHGFVAADSHTDVPVDGRTLEPILQQDALPYAWLASCLDSVMPAHVVYAGVDGVPAGFSAHWLQDVLRGQLGFSGAIFSDDLSMEGAKVAGTAVEAAICALDAGCDMVLLCNQSLVDGGQPIDELLEGLSKALVDRRWKATPDSERRRLNLLPSGFAASWKDLEGIAAYQAALFKVRRLTAVTDSQA